MFLFPYSEFYLCGYGPKNTRLFSTKHTMNRIKTVVISVIKM